MVIMNSSCIQRMQPSVTNCVKHIQLINIAQARYNLIMCRTTENERVDISQLWVALVA
jgi:hypothetical protein